MTIEPIKIEGLAEFQRAIRKLDAGMPKALRLAMNDAVNIVVDEARPRVPTLTGRAQSTVKARSTRTSARVSAGGRRAPYFPWLDFGGSVGRNRSVKRAFLKQGRYIWKAYADKRPEFQDAMVRALMGVAIESGLELTP